MLNSKTGKPDRMGKGWWWKQKKSPLSIERNSVKDVVAEAQDSLFLPSHHRPLALSGSQGIMVPQLLV